MQVPHAPGLGIHTMVFINETIYLHRKESEMWSYELQLTYETQLYRTQGSKEIFPKTAQVL